MYAPQNKWTYVQPVFSPGANKLELQLFRWYCFKWKWLCSTNYTWPKRNARERNTKARIVKQIKTKLKWQMYVMGGMCKIVIQLLHCKIFKRKWEYCGNWMTTRDDVKNQAPIPTEYGSFCIRSIRQYFLQISLFSRHHRIEFHFSPNTNLVLKSNLKHSYSILIDIVQ